MPPLLPDGYTLLPTTPDLDDYLAMRDRCLTPKTRAQAEAGLPGSWTACHVRDLATGRAVGMGRVIGDGGWAFQIVDVAVLPEHRRRGLGDAVITHLLDEVRARAVPGPYVTLLADEPARGLYARHGFHPSAPRSIGMVLQLP